MASYLLIHKRVYIGVIYRGGEPFMIFSRMCSRHAYLLTMMNDTHKFCVPPHLMGSVDESTLETNGDSRDCAKHTRDRSDACCAMAYFRTGAARASGAMSRTCKVIYATANDRCRPLQAWRPTGSKRQPRRNASQTLTSCKLQVLFCGEELPYSYRYTSEALQGEGDIQVLSALTVD